MEKLAICNQKNLAIKTNPMVLNKQEFTDGDDIHALLKVLKMQTLLWSGLDLHQAQERWKQIESGPEKSLIIHKLLGYKCAHPLLSPLFA